MLQEIKNIKSEPGDLKKFAWTVGAVLSILGIILWLREKNYFLVLMSAGIILLALSFLYLRPLKPIYKAWMVLALILGWLMTRVILSLFFFVIFTPISLISRLFGNKFLDLKWDKAKKSHWNYRTNRAKNKEDYERQF